MTCDLWFNVWYVVCGPVPMDVHLLIKADMWSLLSPDTGMHNHFCHTVTSALLVHFYNIHSVEFYGNSNTGRFHNRDIHAAKSHAYSSGWSNSGGATKGDRIICNLTVSMEIEVPVESMGD